MVSHGRRSTQARKDEQRREERGEQQAPAPQGPTVLPPPPPVDYGVFMQGLAPAPVPQEHGHGGLFIMERFKRMAPPPFKGESQPLLADSWMREVEKIFRAIRRSHGGIECWKLTGKCLKCGSTKHQIRDCPRLQQFTQRGVPAPAVAVEAAPVTGKPGRPQAQAQVNALAREDAEQAENVKEGTVLVMGVQAQVLFDMVATHSFISERFAKQLAAESGVEAEEL
ncbi:hypothetical protein Taro_016305 [Colocasia esculenta]|uniref:CCHC-type domain-containing protein n=1 Tax=Colocasia esculenta TaxID=4460 RepID=A0A843UVU2_COLES|nr:hypothetical protein [Colocasia esculenta]